LGPRAKSSCHQLRDQEGNRRDHHQGSQRAEADGGDRPDGQPEPEQGDADL
jgi:hypothetical protein